MKYLLIRAVSASLVLSAGTAAAATTFHVSAHGSHQPPFADWATAATDIQSAIDAAADGDTVLVTNGVYATGGEDDSRVVLKPRMTVRSVNGPEHTWIVGQGPIGPDAVRCATLYMDSVLSGFTLTNGHTRATSGGGFISNGGGVYGSSIVSNCVIVGNHAGSGGGAYLGLLRNCIVNGNTAAFRGGGVSRGLVENCTVTENHAGYGGGTSLSEVWNSIVYYNTADPRWANTSTGAVHYTCTIPDPGGTGNITNAPGLTARGGGRLAPGSPCINAGTNLAWSATGVDIDGEPRLADGTVDIGCDEFQPGAMTGPLQVAIRSDFSEATVGYPLRFWPDIAGRTAGLRWDWQDGTSATHTSTTTRTFSDPGDYDIVLTAWNLDGSASATTTVHIVAGITNFVSLAGNHTPPFDSWAAAATNVQAAISAATVPGTTVLLTNGVYRTGSTLAIGDTPCRIAITNAVIVRSVNGPEHTLIEGSGPLGSNAVRCAYIGRFGRVIGITLTNGHTQIERFSITNATGGGAWCEAEAVLEDCIIAGNHAYYRGGGSFQGIFRNCRIEGNSAEIGGGISYAWAYDSALIGNLARNDDENGVDNGGGAESSTLYRCTITNNQSRSGGGASYSVIKDSLIESNIALYAGGVYNSNLRNCLVQRNEAERNGGGVLGGTVENCTIAYNSAGYAGGAWGATMRNCIVIHNETSNYGSDTKITYTCTTPLPPGSGNIANDPQFVDAGSSNFHLSATSPCIDAGTNEVWMAGAVDLDGNPRVYHRAVDMGCYEFPLGKPDLDADYLDDDWELGYFPGPGGLTNLSYYADWDGDGFLDGDEFHAGTRPDDAASRLGVTSVVLEPAGDRAVIRWSSVSNKTYAVMGVSNLVDSAAIPLAVAIPATPPENVYTDAVHGIRWRAYGVEVERE